MARKTDNDDFDQLPPPEQWVVRQLRHAAETTRAPAGLRERLEAQRSRGRPGNARGTAWPLKPAYAAMAASALALVALAIVLVSPAGTPAAPSVSQAAGLALRGSAAPAPTTDARHPAKLRTDVEDVYFPNWAPRHWPAVGQRWDRIDGRSAATVYYDLHGKRIAYTIVSAPALSQPAASTTTLNGTELRTFKLDGREVVTWRRAGHTCILSGAGVPAKALQRLASLEPS